jgi:hypothetical protein
MKKLLVTVPLFLITTTASAGERYADLTYNYFYGDKSKISVNVKRVIASDKETSAKVLKYLTQDSDVAVWLSAEANLKNLQ